MAKKKIVIDEVHGAQGAEMSDDDVAELAADTRDDREGETPEPVTEVTDTVDEDLPEGVTKPEVDEPAEPDADPEVERLKELGLYRPGMIESMGDLGKSYQHLEKEFSRRPTVEGPTAPAYDPQEAIDELQEELQTNPVAAIAKIANAMNEGTRSELSGLKDQLFYGSRPEATEYKDDIVGIQKDYPGMGIQDAYDMAKGRDSGKVVAQATKTEKRRATERQVALREKSGGVRTTPVDAVKAVEAAAAGGGSAQDKIDRMVKSLETAGMGATD